MTEIAIPESLQFYFKSLENARSIERLIDSRSSKASEIEDMDWDDLRQFYQAQLAAFKTQMDCWTFCDDIWNLVWGEAVASLSGAVEIDSDDYKGERNLSYVWDNGMCRIHEWKGGRLVTKIYCGMEYMWVGFYYEDSHGEYEASNGLVLSDNWEAEEDDERNLKKKLVNPRGQGTLDLNLWENEAKAAITALQKKLA
jgi:hypothetical protein